MTSTSDKSPSDKGGHDIDNGFRRTDPYGLHMEPTYSGATSFMRRKYSRDLDGIDVAVTGVPLDTATTNRPGTRFGPRAIRTESSNIAWARPYNWDFEPFEKLAVVDYGDCYFDHGHLKDVPAAIEAHIAEILDAGTAALTLGGDHFLTYPVIRAHAAKHGPVALVQFDAHTDTWHDEDQTRIDHGTMFYHAVQDGTIDPEVSVQVGIRTYNSDTLGITVVDANAVHENGPKAAAARIREVVGDRPVYLTFDIDCLDPAFAPGTGTPVIGGLTPYQAMTTLREMAGINLVGMDVVEVSPPFDVAGVTALAGATLAYEMLALYCYAQKS
ncbi:MAG: agmatinase [Hyphomicrobiales bacterium]